MNELPNQAQTIQKGFEKLGYICSDQVALAIFLSKELGKPLLIEGPPGVGKTKLADIAADFFKLPLFRIQCHEGLDENQALYEWKYGKQLLYTQILKDRFGEMIKGCPSIDEAMEQLRGAGDAFFSEDFLEPRPLLQALSEPKGAVLLIDEIDKSTQEFEALLLEALAEGQVSIPEIGKIRAQCQPLVFLTSNDTRELGDALKRRCLHLHIPYPDMLLEQRIVAAQIPEIDRRLLASLCGFVRAVRELDLQKKPAASETIDWARALVLLHCQRLDAEIAADTLNLLLKFHEDIENCRDKLPALLTDAQDAAPIT